MVTLAYWQIFLATFLAGFISFFLGVITMALAAMAHYDGDEKRSEPQ